MPCASLGCRAARDRRATQGRLTTSGWPATQPSQPALQEDVPLPAKGPSRTRLETHSLETRPGGASWRRRSDCWPVGDPNPRCHSTLSAPFRYARRRVAVWAALPLGPERTVLVRSTSSGSVGGTATRPWACSPAWPALPLGPERTVSVRSTSSGSVRACSPYVHHRVAVWAALPLGPERAAPRGRHCHSGLDVPFRYARRRVAV